MPPIIRIKKNIVPELNGKPKVLTKNISIFPANHTTPGIITKNSNPKIAIPINKAIIVFWL